MGRLLIKPVTFLDHLEGSVCLLRLIIVIELPRQISDREKKNDHQGDNPECSATFKQASCHVEWSRLERRSFMRRRETSLILNVQRFLDYAALRSE